MSAYIRLILVFICVCLSVDIYPQIGLHKKNQYDSEGKKHGYWIKVSKSDPGKKTFKGWYEHGNETKRCTYYINGVRWSKFRYVNDSLMRMKRYTMEGNLDYKGSALLLRNNDEIRFCWDGEFVFYDSQRHKIKKVIYVRGVEQDLE
jgi:antitoxin component YwqK of YwqJK toxin-antitoxin module